MSSGFSTDHQADTLARDLYRAGAVLVDDLETTNAEAGRIVLARTNPPRRSGELAAGMFAEVTPTSTVLASHARHFTFVHWGAPRHHVKAQPFILAAVRATRAEVINLYTDHARHAVGQVKD